MTRLTRPTFASFAAMLGVQLGKELNPGPGILSIDFNGIPFMVAHDPATWGVDHVAFICDFGDIPKDRRGAILEHLLMANIQMHGLWSPIFAIDPKTGHLVSIMALPLEMLDAETTMQTFVKYAVVVHRWNTTHFLEEVVAGSST